MIAEKTSIDGLVKLRSPVIEDERGFFLESFKASALDAVIGDRVPSRQSNHSRSVKNTLRGFHQEAWSKLVYVPRGTALIVILDSRPDSTTFGQHESFLLGDAPGQRLRLYVSKGLSNAFYCLTDVDYVNDVSDEYDPKKRWGFRWNDPLLNVDWPTGTPILSAQDAAQPLFSEVFTKAQLARIKTARA